jgi:hypothetical protein
VYENIDGEQNIINNKNGHVENQARDYWQETRDSDKLENNGGTAAGGGAFDFDFSGFNAGAAGGGNEFESFDMKEEDKEKSNN